MLSKSQARMFFLTMTGGFSAVFLWLTVDTLQQVPARSNESEMTEQVVRGKMTWEQNNCMGCHTILGEGAYYAPELTDVVERRGAGWIKQFLKDPEAMFPGRRKMVNYHFTDEQIDDEIAFLTWVGKIDTNGFPAPHDLAPVMPSAAAATGDHDRLMATAPARVASTCLGCHAVGGKGGTVGPAFDGLSKRRDRAFLDAWLADPAAVKPGTTMPNLQIPPDERAQLVDWLLTLP